jgi:hypothetical protein
MLRFGKLDHLVFQCSVRCGVCVAIAFHSSHLGFYAMLSINTLLTIHVISLLIERYAYTQD